MLQSLGLSHTNVAYSLGALRATVVHALRPAAAQSFNRSDAVAMSDHELES